MAPAMDERPRALRPLDAGQAVVAVIAVALQERSAKALEKLFGISAAASRRITEQDDRRTGAAMPPVIGGDRPEEARLRPAPPGIEHRRGGFVHEQAIGLGEMQAHVVGDRLQMEAGPAGPVAKRRPIKPDALPGVDVRLPVERQMVAEFGDDDLGDQAFRRQAAGHHMFRRVCLHDRTRATPAGVFRPPGDKHAQLRRDHVEALRDIFADLRHRAAAARAKGAFRLDHALHPRQVRGQMAAIAVAGRGASSGFAADGGFGLFLRGVEKSLRDLDVFERQIELVGTQLLRPGTELLVPEIADDRLEPAARLLRNHQCRLMLGERGLRLRQERLQPLILFRQGGNVQSYTCQRVTPYWRATSATRAPGNRLSATIRAFSAGERRRRPDGPSITSSRPANPSFGTPKWASILPSLSMQSPPVQTETSSHDRIKLGTRGSGERLPFTEAHPSALHHRRSLLSV